MLALLLALAADSSKRCDLKDLRSAAGLQGCTALDFQFEPLSAAEQRAAAAAISAGGVKVVICRGCALGNYGMALLAPALLGGGKLEFLTFREDALDLSGARTLAQLLNETALPGLDLRAAGLVPDGGIELAAALRSNEALEILNLKASGIGAVGAAAVAAALRENVGLQWLDMSFNRLGDDGAAVLAAALSARDEPLTLMLEDPTVGPAGLQALEMARKENPRHEVLLPPESHLPKNRMPRRGSRGSIGERMMKTEL